MKKRRSFPLVLVALVLFFQSLIGIPSMRQMSFQSMRMQDTPLMLIQEKFFSTKTATLPKALLLSLNDHGIPRFRSD